MVGNAVSIQDTGAREQVERLVRSKTFETSEVHRRLLQYLAEKTLCGEADRLKEYVIGLEAFSKPSTYDPKRDSIVRLQVGRLRQKLAAYYQSEASDDPVLVSVPKGAFKLTFEPNQSGTARQIPPDPQRKNLVLTLALVAASLWALGATVWLIRVHAREAVIAERWNAELETLWNLFLQSNRPMHGQPGDAPVHPVSEFRLLPRPQGERLGGTGKIGTGGRRAPGAGR